MSQPIKYNFSPSLLNQFALFLTEKGYEKEGENIPFVNFQKLLDSINRIPFPTSEAMQNGIDFETAVIDSAKIEYSQILEHKTDSYKNVVHEMVHRLPPYFNTQKFVQRQHKDILIYGYTDVMGQGRIIDIKTSGYVYSFGSYLTSHQNLYLWIMQDKGYSTMEYFITNFKEVWYETYGLDYDFQSRLQEAEHFTEFCEDHRELISNHKIFNYRYGK